MITEQFRDRYRQARWALILRGLLGIAIAVLIFTRPLRSVAVLALVIAVWALFDGIVRIVQAIDLRGVTSDWWMRLVTGIIGVIFGFLALYFYPTLSLAFAVIWTGLWLLTLGVLGLYLAFRDRRATESWGWTLTWAIIGIVAGVLALANPHITLAWLMGLIAAFGLIDGVALLLAADKMQGVERRHGPPMMHPIAH